MVEFNFHIELRHIWTLYELSRESIWTLFNNRPARRHWANILINLGQCDNVIWQQQENKAKMSSGQVSKHFSLSKWMTKQLSSWVRRLWWSLSHHCSLENCKKGRNHGLGVTLRNYHPSCQQDPLSLFLRTSPNIISARNQYLKHETVEEHLEF